MSGTEKASAYVLCSTEKGLAGRHAIGKLAEKDEKEDCIAGDAYRPTRLLCGARMCLHACHAMSATSYAMSGTDIAHHGMPVRYWPTRGIRDARLRGMSGTDTAHGAMGLRTCYAMSGTDIP
eukprot:769599-Rhodomonas_salina.1